MSEIRLETVVVPSLVRTPSYGFAMMAYADMLQMGQTDLLGGAPFGADDAAVAARVGAETVGILTFIQGDPVCASVGLAYVLPNYRRRGILRYMFDELVKWCEREGRRVIEFDSPIQNSGPARALVACGMSVVSHRYRVEVGT